ncbi:MAG: M24 family metallopeptidase [Plectolyngbya sp. WJT66-NPBG17]|jgi:Xaa-Pro aminopeptidase|nr:M24 family metallopeptidase [Plectolyngbya sp. WJT66-NPBG17]MBW4525987.1 M24 family metallopeptidase [Phormidium tanganyikae FI6-MK23]
MQTQRQPSAPSSNRSAEIAQKLAWMRDALRETDAVGLRLRGIDWFAWATAGGSNVVLLAAETGVAEVFVTLNGAWILTDEIEAQRLQDEEVPAESDYQWAINPWAKSDDRESFVREATQGKRVISDLPVVAEASLPQSLIERKRVLLPIEIDRYRQVGKLASEAMTEVLTQASPDWTEVQLAGAGAAALWTRGLHPALTLAAGEQRLPRYRHTLPKQEKIGRAAMLVFCARGFGLYANLTRFVYFDRLSASEVDGHRQIREIEATALDQCRVGTPLNQIYRVLQLAYEHHRYSKAILEHHQGGTTGYLSREVVATPETLDRLSANITMAWNPSLPGAKIEDTFLLHEDNRLENLTLDPRWQNIEINGRQRPLPLEII